jgi:hypothetical protein
MRPGLRTTLGIGRRQGPLLIVLGVVAALAIALQRNGTSWGDDFTLYLRQAKSIVDGNVGQVIADNHFNVDNAAKPGFSPYVYPWGWPLLLAPFFRLWGLDYDRLKLLEVACLCGFLAFFHAIIRPRADRWLALGVVAATGSTLAYLQHTDGLLSEYPYMLGVAATLWSLDRCRHGHTLDRAARGQLVVLGLLAMAVFNIRREGLAIVAAIVAVQLVEARHRWRRDTPADDRIDWRALATPHMAFFGGAILLQLMLPSALAPQYDGAGLAQTWKKLHGSFRVAFGQQLGFDHLVGIGMFVVLVLVGSGVAVRLRRHAADDIGLVVFALLSMVIVGMIPAVADRYLLAVTPFAVYFAAQAIAAVPLPKHVGHWLAVAALALLALFHVTKLPDPIRNTSRANASGLVQDGPASAYAVAAFDAVEKYTHQDDVVAFFKARALTFYTNRRSVQSSDLEILRERSDYFMMRRNSSFSQPLVTDDEAAAMGWIDVWNDTTWVLWKVARPAP